MSILWRHARIATLSGPDWGLIERGALVVEGRDGDYADRQGIGHGARVR